MATGTLVAAGARGGLILGFWVIKVGGAHDEVVEALLESWAARGW
jgi:hypothetical protein